MRTVIKDGIVLSMTSDILPIEVKDIFIDDDRIVGLGSQGKTFSPAEIDRQIDAKDCIVMPGLINAHTHTPMTFMRSLRDDKGSFMEPNSPPMLPADKNWIGHINPEDIYWSSKLAIAEMIRGGTTTFVDMFNQMDRVAQAVIDTGVRGVLGWEIVTIRNDPNQWLPYDEDAARRTYEESGKFISEWHKTGNGRVTAVVAPHETGTCHEPWLSKAANLAEELGVDISIHVAETEWEVQFCHEKYSLTPAELLEQTSILDHHVIGAHSLYMNDRDFKLLAKYDYHPVSCPQGNLKLAKPMTRVVEMLANDLNVSLGTDSALTNNNLDMWEEIRLTSLIQKHIWHDPAVLPGLTALELATSGGARAINCESLLGSLEVGKKADIIIVSSRFPHWHPLEGVLPGNLLYSSLASDVRTVLVDGEILMQDWEIVSFDEKEVIDEADRRIRRLRSQIGLPFSFN